MTKRPKQGRVWPDPRCSLSALPQNLQEEVRAVCRQRMKANLRSHWEPCSVKNHACFTCQDAARVRLGMEPLGMNPPMPGGQP